MFDSSCKTKLEYILPYTPYRSCFFTVVSDLSWAWLTPKMATRTITILQHLLQNCYCASGHFWTSGTKGLKDTSPGVIFSSYIQVWNTLFLRFLCYFMHLFFQVLMSLCYITYGNVFLRQAWIFKPWNNSPISPVKECTFCIVSSYAESTLLYRWCPPVNSRLYIASEHPLWISVLSV